MLLQQSNLLTFHNKWKIQYAVEKDIYLKFFKIEKVL